MGIWNSANESITLDLIPPVNQPTPTPTEINQFVCCSDEKKQTQIVNGNGDDLNQVSVNSNIDGTLCFDEISPGTTIPPFTASIVKDGVVQGNMLITISGTLSSTTFRFLTETDCYEGQLTTYTEANIFNNI